MSAQALFQYVLGLCWDLLSFEVPGLGVSCKVWVIALVLVNLSILAARIAFDLGYLDTFYRSSSSRNAKISDKRKGDEF